MPQAKLPANLDGYRNEICVRPRMGEKSQLDLLSPVATVGKNVGYQTARLITITTITYQ
jgi:hypothetical protein